MGKSYQTHCVSGAMVCVGLVTKLIPTHETAPLFLYNLVKLATYSLLNSILELFKALNEIQWEVAHPLTLNY